MRLELSLEEGQRGRKEDISKWENWCKHRFGFKEYNACMRVRMCVCDCVYKDICLKQRKIKLERWTRNRS